MSWRLFTATCAASLFLASCGDSDKGEKQSESVQDGAATINIRKETVDTTEKVEERIAEVKAVVEEKDAEIKAKAEEVTEKVEEKVADYKAMIDKYLKMDMTAVKSDLGNQNETILNGLASNVMETIKAETAKITKLSESLKNLDFSSLSKAPELKAQIDELTKSKDKLTELYDAVKAQVKALTGK